MSVTEQLQKMPLVPSAPDRRVVSVPDGRGKVQKIRGKLLRALALMIWGNEEGRPLDWADAARAAGMTTAAMRRALEKPHVRGFIAAEKRICRDAVGAANVMVAKQIRDQSENSMARIRALAWLEGDTAQASAGGYHGVTPGVVVHVNVGPRTAPVDDTIIEINPGQVPEDTAHAR